MNKKPILNILLTFYRKDTMKYVGTQWKGGGFLLLLALCAYSSLFIGYARHGEFKNSYKSVYRPTLTKLPDVKLQSETNTFVFDSEMPLKIDHPVTREPVLYIDTTTDQLPETPLEQPLIISKSVIPSYLVISHSDFNSLIFKLEKDKTYKSKELIDHLDTLNTWWLTIIIIGAFTAFYVIQLSKTLLITFIVMIMFKNGIIKKDFKLISRLCILTYIPVLFIHGTYDFFLVEMGIVMIIFLSFFHIVLLMKAVAANNNDEDPKMAPLDKD
jgi:hypothetical protein